MPVRNTRAAVCEWTIARFAGRRLFAAARTQALRNGLRWPAVDGSTSLLDRVTRALSDDEAEQARADGARLTLADVAAGIDVTESAPA